MKTAIILAILALTSFVAAVAGGCVSSSPIVAPNGHPGHAVSCRIHSDCFGRAGELCPAGYDIVEENTSAWKGTTDLIVACR